MKYECHAHIYLNGYDFEAAKAAHKDGPSEELVRSTLLKYKEAGIGYIRDGGDKFGVSLLAAKLAPEYGIDFVSPAFAIYKKGNYGAFLGRSWADLKEYEELVSEAKKLGASYIKLMISGILDFSEYGKLTGFALEKEELKAMADIAHQKGLAVMAHANGAECIKNAALAGIDSIEHGYYMDEEALNAMAEMGTFWVPTAVTSLLIQGTGRFPDEMLALINNKHLENIEKAYNMGVKTAPGSDAGSFGVLHAKGCLEEYKLLSPVISEEEQNKNAELLAQRFKPQF